MPNPVVHFEVVGKDAKRLQTFYGQAFGWKINADNPFNYGIVDTGHKGGIAGGVGGAPDGKRNVTIYVQVPDLKKTLDLAVHLGGKVVLPPTDMGMVVMAQFTDPEGNLIGLVKG